MATGGRLKNILATVVTTGRLRQGPRYLGMYFTPWAKDHPMRFCGRSSLVIDKVAGWYPYDIKKDDPLIMACQEQVRLSKLEMLKHHGKGPPKKGQRKHAAKRSK